MRRTGWRISIPLPTWCGSCGARDSPSYSRPRNQAICPTRQVRMRRQRYSYVFRTPSPRKLREKLWTRLTEVWPIKSGNCRTGRPSSQSQEEFLSSWISASTGGMTDNLTKEQRSLNMSRIRRRDTKPELALRRALWRAGLRGYRVDKKTLPGRPDVAWGRARLAVFVDGAFWHGHPSAFTPG